MALKARERRIEIRRSRRQPAAPEAPDSSEIDDLKAELVRMNAEIERLSVDAAKGVTEAAEVKDALDKERSTNAALRRQNKELADDLADAEDEVVELKKRMTVLVQAAKSPPALQPKPRGPASMQVLD